MNILQVYIPTLVFLARVCSEDSTSTSSGLEVEVLHPNYHKVSLMEEMETTRQLSGRFVANVFCVFWSLLSGSAQLSGVLFSLISPVLCQTFFNNPSD